jgi:prepilin-type N-terminal cleavage/methylation domain-containing protein
MAFIIKKRRDIVRCGAPNRSVISFDFKTASERKDEKNGMSYRKGFTLLETMFAILIVSIGILGINNGMNFAIKNTRLARENFAGTYLAQEGVEIVKNIRDNNWVNDRQWDNGLTSCGSGCHADYATTTLSAGAGNAFKLDANGFYNYSSGTTTIYSRKITIVPVDLNSDSMNEELDITVDVFWNNITTTVKENIYNWYMPAS